MTLSIVVPAFNEEKIIERTLKQIHDNLPDIDHEILIADDGSSDRTIEIASHYGKVVSRTGPKGTIGANRNHGAREATGEFIAFIDADIFIPNPDIFFNMLLKEFAADKNLSGVTVKIKIFPDEASAADNMILEFMGFVQWLHNDVMRSGSASGEFQMIRRSAFEAAKGYDERLPVGEDNDLFMRLSQKGRTHMAWSLTAYTTHRRSRQMGWAKLIWLWTLNYISVLLFKKSYSKEWPPHDK